MSGIGEGILLDLVTGLIIKSITIAIHIARHQSSSTEDKHCFCIRLNVQIGLMEEAQKVLKNQNLSSAIPIRDRYTYFHVMAKMHHPLLEYVMTMTNVPKNFVDENSATGEMARFREIELADPNAAAPTRAQESSWLRTKEKVTWALYKKEKFEKLVVEVETWGECLARLFSFTIPCIFIQRHFSAAEIAENAPSEELGEAYIKSRLLVERKAEEESKDGSVATVQLESTPTTINFSQLQFLSCEPLNVKQPHDGDEKDPERTDLGGASKRCWARLLDETGNRSIGTSRVIVEFKERPAIVGSNNEKTIRRELKSLVRIIRLGSQKFQLLYCHGFYETREHYGLVYQLPAAIHFDCSYQTESLGTVLLNEHFTTALANDLENRLVLGKALATTMYHLHSVQWVHKSFNPDNVLLFYRKSQGGGIEIDWSRPYIVGFDTSRSFRGVSAKLPPSFKWENRVYTHPARQRANEYEPFRMLFDIYSLGVVLLEICQLKCFKHSDYRTDLGWTEIVAEAVQKRLQDLAHDLVKVVGKTYAEIVETCLSGKFRIDAEEDDAEETELKQAFLNEVCEKFDQIRY